MNVKPKDIKFFTIGTRHQLNPKMCKSDCIHSSFTNINGFSKYFIGIFGNMEYSLLDYYSDLREKRSEIIKLEGCRLFFYPILIFELHCPGEI